MFFSIGSRVEEDNAAALFSASNRKTLTFSLYLIIDHENLL